MYLVNNQLLTYPKHKLIESGFMLSIAKIGGNFLASELYGTRYVHQSPFRYVGEGRQGFRYELNLQEKIKLHPENIRYP